MKIKLWPKDATTTGERIKYVAVQLFVASLYLFLQLSAWQVFKNDYQAACKEAGVIFHAIGGVLTVLSLTGFWMAAKDKFSREVSGMAKGIGLFVISCLTFLAYAGFNI